MVNTLEGAVTASASLGTFAEVSIGVAARRRRGTGSPHVGDVNIWPLANVNPEEF